MTTPTVGLLHPGEMGAVLGAVLRADGIAALLTNGNGKNMKPFAEKLSKDEIHAVAEFVKTLKPAGS